MLGSETADSANYPQNMAGVLVDAFGRWKDQTGEENIVVVKAVRQTVEEHLRNNHQPYSKDCLACLEGAGRGHQHRRIQHPAPRVLSADVGGPFPKGKKGERYFVALALTVAVDGKKIGEDTDEIFSVTQIQEEELLEDDPFEEENVKARVITARIPKRSKWKV